MFDLFVNGSEDESVRFMEALVVAEARHFANCERFIVTEVDGRPAVASRPEFRRMGLVSRMIEEMLDRGRQRGATVAEISVLIGNDPAQRAYEKAGFEVVDEARHPLFESIMKCPGIRLLRRAI